MQIYKPSPRTPRPEYGESVADYIQRLRAAGIKTPSARMIKTKEQIEGCIRAGEVNSAVLDAVDAVIKEGISTEDIDRAVCDALEGLGAKSACLGFEGYPKSVCTSLNNVICHGIPSEKEILREGDIINVDCTSEYGGYFGDASRMYAIGEISQTAKRLIEVTRECVEAAVENIRPYDSHLGDVGYYISRHARANGFNVVREIGGHGVGLKMHEDPFVCHRGILGSGMVLLPGMIFTVEPMVNEGSAGFYIDKRDGWTVYTEDGRLSAQIEYELLITEDGVEILSK